MNSEICLGEAGSTVKNYDYSSSPLNPTDANPYIINGDFSTLRVLYAQGYYSDGAKGDINKSGWAIYEPTFGQTYRMYVGKVISSGALYNAYRRFKIYSDRIEIGGGGYTNMSTYTDASGIGIITQVITA